VPRLQSKIVIDNENSGCIASRINNMQIVDYLLSQCVIIMKLVYRLLLECPNNMEIVFRLLSQCVNNNEKSG
jgi:hypothetical protein